LARDDRLSVRRQSRLQRGSRPGFGLRRAPPHAVLKGLTVMAQKCDAAQYQQGAAGAFCRQFSIKIWASAIGNMFPRLGVYAFTSAAVATTLERSCLEPSVRLALPDTGMGSSN